MFNAAYAFKVLKILFIYNYCNRTCVGGPNQLIGNPYVEKR